MGAMEATTMVAMVTKMQGGLTWERERETVWALRLQTWQWRAMPRGFRVLRYVHSPETWTLRCLDLPSLDMLDCGPDLDMALGRAVEALVMYVSRLTAVAQAVGDDYRQPASLDGDES